MNEVIEAIVNDAVERAMAFSPGDQSFIYSEVSDRLSDLSHTALMTEYGLKRGGLRMSRNYARFYVLLNRLPTADRDELKATLVSQYTGGRTESLREMTNKEYDAMCEAMQQMDKNYKAREAYREELRRKRSTVLKLLQKQGIDTTDWDRVDTYCENPRIAGKRFARLTTEELEAVAVKLRIIQRKEREKNTDYSQLN